MSGIRPSMTSGRPNVLLIVLDSVRARNTSLYGHRNETTPFLSSFASSATVYEHAVAPGMWSLPSHVSIFTGYDAVEHGIRSRSQRLTAGHSVFEKLSENGYRTGVFSENPFLVTENWGLATGFDDVVNAPAGRWFPEAVEPGDYQGDPVGFLRAAATSGTPVRSLLNGALDKLLWDYPELVPDAFAEKSSAGNFPGERFTEEFLDWHADRDGPWAACINYMDAHHPYYPTDEHNQWGGRELEGVRDSVESIPNGFYDGTDPWWKFELMEYLYDGTVRQIDSEVETVLRTLERRDALADTLVVVVADHGEGFGDTSEVKDDLRIGGHNIGVHECLLHVPMLVQAPGQSSGERIEDLATPSGFSAAVRRCTDLANDETSDGDVADSFVADGPLRVPCDVGTGMDDDLRSLVDADEYPNDARVVYEMRDGRRLKHVVWGDDAATLRIVDPRTSYRTDGDPRRRVADVYDRVTDAGLNADSAVEDSETRERLEDLGYL